MDVSFMLTAERILRPGCVPWESHAAGTNGGTVEQECIGFQVTTARRAAAAATACPPLTSVSVVQLQGSSSAAW